MTAMIIEDESFARAQLSKILASNFPEISICATASSVQSAVAYLQSNTQPDIIFMDVELSDGDAFEIFRSVPISAQVIMTTAYDTYAIKAFEAGSIDYLLKPIELSALQRAVARCQGYNKPHLDIQRLLSAVEKRGRRIMVKHGDKIIPLEISEVAYFYSEGKANYLTTVRAETFIIDSTIDQLAREYEGEDFFRVGRGCIVSRSAVRSVRHSDGKHRLELQPAARIEISVSRSRIEAFLDWLK